jgi:Uma2 family endonuclease
MSQTPVPLTPEPIDYPDSDGLPIADTSLQFDWIALLANNLQALFRERPDVFVSGDQFWYPVKGEPRIHTTPDVFAIFGRPKGYRGSYKQWEEGDIPMTVVFEVHSPNNTPEVMAAKFSFYEKYGVEEYFVIDPGQIQVQAYLREGGKLVGVAKVDGHTSPRLGIRFELSGPKLVVRYPDGRPFLTFVELATEIERAEQRYEQAKQRADQIAQRKVGLTERQWARLEELGHKHLQQQATSEELQELRRLLGGP